MKQHAKRIIRHLTRGVFPPHSIENLTVGRDKEQRIVKGHLDDLKKGKGAHLFLEANYGYGKSHMLKLIESLALKENFATTFITLDSYQHAFNHPTRYLHHFLKNIRHRDANVTGLATLCEYWLTNGKADSILRWANRCPYERFKIALNGLHTNNNVHASRKLYFYNLLECEDLIYKDGRRYYEEYYLILNIVSDLLRSQGLSGLVIMYDELESIVTLLRNVRTEMNCFELLDKFTKDSKFPNTLFVFSVTPDFDYAIKEKESYYNTYNYLYKDGVRFVKKWIRGEYDVCKLSPIRLDDIIAMCKKLMEVHGIAYSWEPRINFTDDLLSKMCHRFKQMNFSEREITRAFLNMLELCHQYPRFKPQTIFMPEGSIDGSGELIIELEDDEKEQSIPKESNMWFKLASWAKKNDYFTPTERRFMFSVGMYIENKWTISDKMKNWAEKIWIEATKKGFK